MVMPGYAASKALPSFSPTGRSIDEYKISLPSFFAASTSAGVIATGSGVWARTGEANTAPAASVAAPCRMSRLESFRPFIASSRFLLLLPAQRPAALGRQRQPDLAAFLHTDFGRRGGAQTGAVGHLHHVVARGAEIDLTRDDALDGIRGRSRRLRRQFDIVLADRNHGALARCQRR